MLTSCYIYTSPSIYSTALSTLLSTLIHTAHLSNQKPADSNLKRLTTNISLTQPNLLSHFLCTLPSLQPHHLTHITNITTATTLHSSTSSSGPKKTIAQNATIHATKQLHDKRSTSLLIALRDIAFYHSSTLRSTAIDCVINIATGQYHAGNATEDKALKLAMNKLYTRSEVLKQCVIESTVRRLNDAAAFAVREYDAIRKANDVSPSSHRQHHHSSSIKHLYGPRSDVEKQAMDSLKKTVLLVMALCVKNVHYIEQLISIAGMEKADVLTREMLLNMPTLAKPVGKLHGSGAIARKIAETIPTTSPEGNNNNKLLFAFLEHLEPEESDREQLMPDFVAACLEIQAVRDPRDPRYLLPVLPHMARSELVKRLASFVAAGDVAVYKAALKRMSVYLSRRALLFRDDASSSAAMEGTAAATSVLTGMTLTEELVYLHHLDFIKAGLPQRSYLDAIVMCLEDDSLFGDRVIMAALDYMSMKFLNKESGLPLAYMRTIIITVNKHESLHMYICEELLPRLIEGRVYEDKRQWEGWMRCASMLESGSGGITSGKAIRALPERQLKIYRSKYSNKKK